MQFRGRFLGVVHEGLQFVQVGFGGRVYSGLRGLL